MRKKIYKMLLVLIIEVCLTSTAILAMEMNEQTDFFYELADELIVKIIDNLAGTGSDPNESLRILANVRLVNKRFNILAQELSIIKDLIKYWSKKLELPKYHLIWDWINIKSKKGASWRKKGLIPQPWFYSFLLKLLDELDVEYLDQSDQNGKKLIILALEKNNLDVINILLKKDIDFKARDDKGRDVLMLAFLNSNEEIIEQILQKEIDISVKDENGKTALDYACDRSNGKLYNLLMRKGADDSNIDYSAISNPLIVIRHGNACACFECASTYAVVLSIYCVIGIAITITIVIVLLR